MTISILSKIFHKHQEIHWDNVIGRRDLLIDLPITEKDRLWKQICYFLYKKNEPVFYQEIYRYYKDEYEKN
jgi:uncharacterized protein with HEPN domain